MNMHLHRKQIVILALAITLAAASYWIPLPRQTDAPPRLLGLTGQATPMEAIAYVREPATVWRFPVTVQVPQTPIQTAVQRSAAEIRPILSSPEERWIDQQDFTDGARSTTYPSLAPVKGLDIPGR